MTSPIRVHRPKCVFIGYTFAQYKPWTTRRGGGDRCTCFDMADGSRPLVIPKVDYNRGLVVCIVEWRKNHHRDQVQPGDWYIFAWTTAPDKARWNTAAEDAGNASKARFYIANNASQVREYVRDNPTHFPPDPLNLSCGRVCDQCGSFAHWTSQHSTNNILPRNPEDLIGRTITVDIPYTAASAKVMDVMMGTTNGVSDETLYRSTRKDGTMNSDALRRQAMLLIEQADMIDSRPKEPTGIKIKKPKGEINLVWWRMRFNPNGRLYTYAAVKADGLWFTTGPRTPKGYTWEQMTNWIYDTSTAGGDPEPEIHYVTEVSV